MGGGVRSVPSEGLTWAVTRQEEMKKDLQELQELRQQKAKWKHVGDMHGWDPEVEPGLMGLLSVS